MDGIQPPEVESSVDKTSCGVRQHQLSKDHVTFAASAIRPSWTVRDLGVMLDSKLSFGPHISRCFLQLSPDDGR